MRQAVLHGQLVVEYLLAQIEGVPASHLPDCLPLPAWTKRSMPGAALLPCNIAIITSANTVRVTRLLCAHTTSADQPLALDD